MKSVTINGKEIILSKFRITALDTRDRDLTEKLIEQFADDPTIVVYPGKQASKASLHMIQNKDYVILVVSHFENSVERNSIIAEWYYV